MLDDISFKILNILQEKARIPNVEVARQVGLAPSAVLERIRKLEQQGYIDGYEVRLNPERFAKSLVVFLTLKMERPGLQAHIGRKLGKIPVVQEIHWIAGEDALLVKLRVADTTELAALIKETIAPVKGIASTHSGIVLETYKESARIPIAKGFKDDK